MKTGNNISRFLIIVSGILFTVVMLSCEKHSLEDPDNTTDRLFRPPTFSASVNDNEVTLTWIPISSASYFLEISKDSLMFETEVEQIALGEVNSHILSDLWSSTRYSARIKAISNDPQVKDSEFIAVTFKTGAENIFFTPGEDDITTTSILLSWNNNKDVDRITISATGKSTRTVLLTSTEVNEGRVLIEELSSGITYTFRIYNGEMLRGTLPVMTVPPALRAPVFINFGMNNSEAGWNNISNITRPFPHVDGTISLIDKEGNSTEVSFVYATAFNGYRHTTGAVVTTIPGFEMPEAVSNQGFYGTNGSIAELRLEGLRQGQAYIVCFFASRVNSNDIRETKYIVTGANEVITALDASNNDSQIACTNSVYPNTDGIITIKLTTGDNNTNSTGFFGINAMRLSIPD